MSEWITAAEAARILGVSQVALVHHRKRGTGPAWIDQRKPGAKNAKPVYDRASVEAYGDKRKRQKDGRSYVERLEALEARVAALGANTPEWLSARETANPRGGNTGLRIGKLAVVDIDLEDPELANRLAVVEWELAKIKRRKAVKRRVCPGLPI